MFGSALLGQWWRITSRVDVALCYLNLSNNCRPWHNVGDPSAETQTGSQCANGQGRFGVWKQVFTRNRAERPYRQSPCLRTNAVANAKEGQEVKISAGKYNLLLRALKTVFWAAWKEIAWNWRTKLKSDGGMVVAVCLVIDLIICGAYCKNFKVSTSIPCIDQCCFTLYECSFLLPWLELFLKLL